MKKALIGALIIVLCCPVFAEDNSTRIAEIEAQIAELEAELAELKGTKSELEQAGEMYELKMSDYYLADSFDDYYDDFEGDYVIPNDGYTFLVVQFDAKNISEEDDYLNRYDFEAYVDGFSVEQYDEMVEEIDILTGDVAAGKTMRGQLLYEIPADWQEFEIQFKESYDADKLVFVLTPDMFE